MNLMKPLLLTLLLTTTATASAQPLILATEPGHEAEYRFVARAIHFLNKRVGTEFYLVGHTHVTYNNKHDVRAVTDDLRAIKPPGIAILGLVHGSNFVGGRADICKWDGVAAVSMSSTKKRNSKTIQHELSHLAGAHHVDAGGDHLMNRFNLPNPKWKIHRPPVLETTKEQVRICAETNTATEG